MTSNPPKGTDLRNRLAMRMAFIDFKVYWEGRINRRNLIETFDISEPQAAIDFRRYQELVPENLSYDRRAKCYRPSKQFRPLNYEPTSDDYLNRLKLGGGELESGIDRWAGPISHFEVVAPPTRTIEPRILRAVVSALHDRGQLEFHYISMSKPNPKWLTVEPRALVFAANRWHVRAYRLDTDIFFDAVLARILDVRSATGDLVSTPEDQDWATFVDVTLVPNPHLGKRMQDVVKRDYAMTRGKRVFNIRKALLFYFINTLPGDFRNMPNRKNPREQDVVILNYAEVREALEG